jgi:hypothetical protein
MWVWMRWALQGLPERIRELVRSQGGQAVTPVSVPPDPYQRALKDLREAREQLRVANERIKRLEREIELFREHVDYGDVCLVEAILKGEEIGRKEKEAKP